MSQTEYCSLHDININQFWNWKSKFNRAGITKKVRSTRQTEPFVSVTVSDDAPSGQTASDSGVTVVLGRGITIHLGRCFDASVLVKAVKALVDF
ncbi:MAG: hypothetical protein KGO02_08525 [Alphaproteobacteria bacterium]|nr:hypothetical protein [Alphaproteobacteria bacterium]